MMFDLCFFNLIGMKKTKIKEWKCKEVYQNGTAFRSFANFD